MEQPDIVIGIHPGLHAEGVYEYWEPTLELLLDKNVKTAFTVLSEEEYVQVSDSHRHSSKADRARRQLAYC